MATALNRPGGHVRDVFLRRAGIDAGVILGGASGIIGAAVVDVVGVALALFAATTIFAQVRIPVLRRQWRGLRAELVVGRRLDQSAAGIVAHAVPIRGIGDADHLVLGPGAVLVETKAAGGVVSTDGRQILLNGRPMRTQAATQAARAAQRTSSLLGVTVQPVVCLVYARSCRVRVNGVLVVSLDQLNDVVVGAPSLDEHTLATAQRRLAEYLHRS